MRKSTQGNTEEDEYYDDSPAATRRERKDSKRSDLDASESLVDGMRMWKSLQFLAS